MLPSPELTLLLACLPVACRGIWRNGLLFSPLLKYAGLSYTDIMTVPLASAMRDALSQAAKTGTLYIPPEATRPVVYMSLQGMLPRAWSALRRATAKGLH